MQTIDAINEMIGYVGESPIDPADTDYTQHPLYESALRILTSTSRMVQAKGWWFNTRETTLTPASNAIAIPDSYLSVAIKDLYREEYAVRSGALFDLTNDTATITSKLEAVVRELLVFEDLPETAAQYIKEAASVRFVQTYDGDRSKLGEVKENRASAYIVFNTDHIRNARVNLFQTRSMGPVMANTWYTRYLPR